MNKIELLALAERCEAATGDSFDLNHAIALAVGRPSEPYTCSLDAAMTLFVEPYFPLIDCDPRHIEVEVQYLTDESDNGLGACVATGGATIPLALCAAALRALATQHPSGGQHEQG